ncbi:hypothetical protein GCM10018793_47350 [Streptomyces sulfonofaciens]|uniref:Iron-binding zinc finger CDGSH type domain-containing protein n=1 Tax=Streptomyces sulfonofaciens TaxID=68272 RepID=A0A919GHH2_9ACTN|nr:CDGSH iron-sulfur domain-containing protein [Streptomyces sulfonofaciens]GHH84033.1 hypothetical protein GCM10018793_47350 [Streptomyces sulfonofaciens]
MPNASDPAARRPCRITLGAEGPLLVPGPVEVVLDDGTVATSDRFTVAVCTCRRTRTPPWCDTSHRRHRRKASRPGGTPRDGARDDDTPHSGTPRDDGPPRGAAGAGPGPAGTGGARPHDTQGEER